MDQVLALAQTDTATVLASTLAAVIAGALTTIVGGVVAIARIRKERREVEARLDLDRFDTSMDKLVKENERLYDEVSELRVSERENHNRILALESELAAANARIDRRISEDDKHKRIVELGTELAVARQRIAELERVDPR